jgi:hypothetical protein
LWASVFGKVLVNRFDLHWFFNAMLEREERRDVLLELYEIIGAEGDVLAVAIVFVVQNWR